MPHIPTNEAAHKLGFESEDELVALLKNLPGAPLRIRQGRITVDPQDVADFLASFGIAVPEEFLTAPDEDDGQPEEGLAEGDDQSGEDQVEGDDHPEQRNADAPRRRR